MPISTTSKLTADQRVDTPADPRFYDASDTSAVHGVVVRELGDHALSASVGVGDLLWRVNGFDVLGMEYHDAMVVVRDASRPLVFEFVPKCCVTKARQLVALRDGERRAIHASEPDGGFRRYIVENPFTVLKRGDLLVQDPRAEPGHDKSWKRCRVVLRACGIEFNRGVRVGSFVGTRRCEVRALPPDPERVVRSSPDVIASHTLELRVDDHAWSLAFTSFTHQLAWFEALTLVCEVSRVLDQGPEDQPKVAQLDEHQVTLLVELLDRERQMSLSGLSCDETTERMESIEWRMSEQLRQSKPDEYAGLEHDMRVYAASIKAHEADEAGRDREWEDAHAAANLEALRAIRRCMPVDIQKRSESELLTMTAPSGAPLPTEMVRKFKTANILELLRMAPAELNKLSKYQLETLLDRECDGLTLTERRALYAHLRELGETLRIAAAQDDDDFGIPTRTWQWFSRFKRTLRCLLAAYERHIAQFGPPGDHKYASNDQNVADPSACGCPLQGKQCPFIADRSPAYDVDLGFPDGDEFAEVKSVEFGRMKAALIVPGEDPFDDIYGYSPADTYGSSGIWTDPLLLRLQRGTSNLKILERGSLDGVPVAVKRLVHSGNTVGNAAMLVTLCKSLEPQHRHPNLVPLLGLVWTKALDLRVLSPWMPGRDLRALLDTSEAASLTWADFKCQVAIDVATALVHLHQGGHQAGLGAITSRNVLLSEGGPVARLNLLQLPCVVLGAARDRVSSPVRYVAPEVILGGASTTSSDVYALGVLLTELDTTNMPFHDAVSPNGEPMDDMLVAMYVARRSMRPKVSLTCPEAIGKLVDKCLTQDPKARPSALSLRYALREILKHEL